MIVAIDGPAGSGKSTVARAIAQRLGFTYLDTGAMYRAVTWKCLEKGIDLGSEESVSAAAEESNITFDYADPRSPVVSIDGADVTTAIRTPEVDANVSQVSAYPGVREAMVRRQRQLSKGADVVAEGRDVGTTVFPHAEVKVFLTADASARAHRRAVQREGGDAAADPTASADPAKEQEILAALERRDDYDSSRKASPLRAAEDAVHIDSSSLTLDEVVGRVARLIEDARAPRKAPEKTVAKENAAAKEPSGKDVPMPAHPAFEDYYEHDMRSYPTLSRAFYHVILVIVGFFTKILWPWHVENGSYLYEHTKDHGSVIAMNHVSMLDPVIIVITMWFHHRRVRILYKQEFDKNKAVTWFFSMVGGIPVKRGTADLKAIRRAQRALQRGESVLIYPEGTRIRTDAEAPDIHGGFSLMAQLAKTDVIPVAIVGARQITPNGTHLKRLFWSVWTRVGEAVSFDDLEATGRKEQLAEMERVAMGRVYGMRDDLRRDHPRKK